MKLLDCIDEANNVYRTKHFIVCQRLSLCRKSKGDSTIISDDTFFLRTKDRDFTYQTIFGPRGKRLEGKRVHCDCYIRAYFD